MSTSPDAPELQPGRIDRLLAFMSLGIVGASVICFFAIMIARPAGVTDFSVGLWPLVSIFPLIGLPIAFLLIIALLILNFVRRGRAGKARA